MLYSVDRKYDTSNQYSGSLVTAMPSRTYPVSLPDFIEGIMLTQQRLKEFLHYDPDTGIFTWVSGPRRGKQAGWDTVNGYRQVCLGGRAGKKYYEHRLAWLYVYGEAPPLIDHINRNSSDNRIDNLRVATDSQNHANSQRPHTNTSGYKGVTIPRGRWKSQAEIGCNGIVYRLGHFDTPEEAYEAYCAKGKELYGEFFYGGKDGTDDNQS